MDEQLPFECSQRKFADKHKYEQGNKAFKQQQQKNVTQNLRLKTNFLYLFLYPLP